MGLYSDRPLGLRAVKINLRSCYIQIKKDDVESHLDAVFFSVLSYESHMPAIASIRAF